jgi:hypothetical protein
MGRAIPRNTVSLSLLAIGNPFDAVGRYLRYWNASVDLAHLAVISAGAILLWAAVTWLEQIRVQHLQNASTPRALFSALCRAHRLGRNERRLLTQAMADAPGPHRCDIFVDPGILRRLSQGNGAEAPAYRELLERLFGSQIARPRVAEEP